METFGRIPRARNFVTSRANAMASAKEILAEELLSGKPVRTGLAFEIFDENHKLVLRFPFAFAAERAGTPP